MGKTTILEIVVGVGEADSGEVSRQKDLRIGYLPQELLDAWQGTVLDEVMSGASYILDLEAQMRSLEAELASGDSDVMERYGELQSQFEQLGGYQLEPEARRILGGLGFTTPDMDRKLAEMSGGWQMRAALARLLLQKPDVLVLDEPTNHLDVDSVLWLEQQLASFPGAILFVSHDRDFIDNVAERVIEVARMTATEYVGGFAEFVVLREERIRMAEAAAANQARKIAHAEQFIERFRYKATKARQVQSRIKTLEKLDKIEVPQIEELRLSFGFPEPRRSSRVVVELVDASIGYDGGPPVVQNVNLVVERGQKIGLIGPNGAGKSTVLKAILGQLKPDKGTCELGNNVDVAYFAQHQVDALDLTKTVAQEFKMKVGEQPKSRNFRTVLGSFGFSGDAVDRKIIDLSGGERTRLALAATMCNPVNLLVLDEPTNHLDIASCDVLEDALSVYPGTVLLVSHDRYLVRNVAESLVVVREGLVTQYLDVEEQILNPGGGGSATSSRLSQSAPVGGRKSDKRKAEKRAEAEDRNDKSKRTKELRKRVGRLERQVGRADEVVTGLEAQLADPAAYAEGEGVAELLRTHEKAKVKAAELLREWEQAAEQLDESSS